MGLFAAICGRGHGVAKEKQTSANSEIGRVWRLALCDFPFLELENGNILTLCPSNRDRHGVVDTVHDSDLALYSMADYLNARIRGRSESINTDASSTVVSPFPTPGPTSSTIPKLTPLIGMKFPTNTILKSHGRPPWYFLGYAHEGGDVLSVF